MKKVLILMLSFAIVSAAQATERFVTFEKTGGALSLHNAVISCSASEHAAVKRAVTTLAEDMERVTGRKPEVRMDNGRTGTQNIILVGTVGCNKQVDEWVRKGILPDLKGKT